MSNDMSVLQGGLLPLTVEQEDATSVSATLILKEKTTDTVITNTAVYVNGVANVSLDESDTAAPGVYEYQINENFANGSADKYPNPDNCEGEFEYPTITIIESLDGAS